MLAALPSNTNAIIPLSGRPSVPHSVVEIVSHPLRDDETPVGAVPSMMNLTSNLGPGPD